MKDHLEYAEKQLISKQSYCKLKKQDIKRWKECIGGCTGVVDELGNIVKKYKSLESGNKQKLKKNFDRIRLGNKNLDGLRSTLMLRSMEMSRLLQIIAVAALTCMAKQLDEIKEYAQEIPNISKAVQQLEVHIKKKEANSKKPKNSRDNPSSYCKDEHKNKDGTTEGETRNINEPTERQQKLSAQVSKTGNNKSRASTPSGDKRSKETDAVTKTKAKNKTDNPDSPVDLKISSDDSNSNAELAQNDKKAKNRYTDDKGDKSKNRKKFDNKSQNKNDKKSVSKPVKTPLKKAVQTTGKKSKRDDKKNVSSSPHDAIKEKVSSAANSTFKGPQSANPPPKKKDKKDKSDQSEKGAKNTK